MHTYVNRKTEKTIYEGLEYFPAVAIIGTRQCGKSTLAKKIGLHAKNFIYLDLESPSDLIKLTNPEDFFYRNSTSLICLDEIQRRPDLFPILRSVIDKNNRPGQFLILGSASVYLLNQSSESLAGRIMYQELTPLQITEVETPSEKKIGSEAGSQEVFWHQTK